jgi:hypothetical protein
MNSWKVKKQDFPSFRRKPESSYFKMFWTPAFAGVTTQGTFYETILKIYIVPPTALFFQRP